jgi:GR25 family glycosyltransferase involved in LPS biosynthesis
MLQKSGPWDFIPRTFVATVQNSKRIPIITNELKRIGITNYEFNEQIPPPKKTHLTVTLSCSDNHLQIYRKALSKNYSFICVLEDDVFIKNMKDISFVMKNVRQFIEQGDWDIIYLGHFPWMIGKEVFPRLRKGVFWCTHAYLINERAMRYMLKYSPEDMLKIGRLAVPTLFDMFFKEGGGIDTFIAYSGIRNRIKIHAVVPMLIQQTSIDNWSLKANLAQWCSHGEWWNERLFRVAWILYWVILLIIIYTIQRKNIPKIKKSYL